MSEGIKVQANADYSDVTQVVERKRSEQFQTMFPSNVEMILRLIQERLQNGLHKASRKPLSNSEVAELSRALSDVYSVWVEVK